MNVDLDDVDEDDQDEETVTEKLIRNHDMIVNDYDSISSNDSNTSLGDNIINKDDDFNDRSLEGENKSTNESMLESLSSGSSDGVSTKISDPPRRLNGPARAAREDIPYQKNELSRM